MHDKGEDAAASALAFVVAGVLFMVAVGTILYIANNKVPPSRENQDFVNYEREARALMKSFVLDDVWDTGSPTFTSADPPGFNPCAPWATEYGFWDDATTPALPAPRLVPTLAESPGRLSERRVRTLDETTHVDYPNVSDPACNPASDGTYDYESLRDLLGLKAGKRDFRVVVVSTESPPVTYLEFGPELPIGLSGEPAVSYVGMEDAPPGARTINVRVTVTVFPSAS